MRRVPVAAAFLFVMAVAAAASSGDPVRAAILAAARSRDAGQEVSELIAPMSAERKAEARGNLEALDRRTLDSGQSRELEEAFRLLGGRTAAGSGSSLTRAASLALDAGRFAEASRLATQALKTDPGDREALTVLHFAKGRATGEGSDRSGSSPSSAPSAGVSVLSRPRQAAAAPGAALPRRFRRSAGAPPSEPFEPALATLARSAVGRDIVDSLKRNGVRIVIKDGLQADAAALYYPSDGAIVVPPAFFSEPRIVQAVILGHEGFHAVQDKEYHSAVSLETEIDAWERQCVMYRELLVAGIPPAPDEHFVAQAYKLFEQSIRRGNLYGFESWVEENYRNSAKANKRALARSLPGPLRGIGFRMIDSLPWPAFRNSVRAYRQEGLRSRLMGESEGLRNAIKHHQDNQSWVIGKTRNTSSSR